jgi:hypothetical protein
MFNFRPPAGVPGFRVGLPDAVPGFRVRDDGSLSAAFSSEPSSASFGHDLYGNAAPPADIDSMGAVDRAHDPVVGRPTLQNPAQWASNPAGNPYVYVSGNRAGFFDRLAPFLADVQDAAGGIGTRANAVVNGAYSVFPGTYNAIRAAGRGLGILGPDEFRRFGQEADFIGSSAGQIVKHPGPAVRAARDAVSVLADNPLLPYYGAGRALMGYFTGLGLPAMAGGALRAVEDGHNLLDAIIQNGIGGVPSAGR